MPRDFLSDDSQEPKMEKIPGRDFLEESPKESLGVSAALAVPRIGEDIIKGGYNFIKNIPDYYQKSKTEVPGLVNSLTKHPMHAFGQAIAGLAEQGQNVFNTPHDIANYATNRLNLIPEDINKKIQMGRMPDSEQDINATFGAPQYPGESLLRGATRNALNMLGVPGIVSKLNPLNLTAKNIAKDVLNTGEQNKKLYSGLYKNLWKDAENKGFGDALYDADIDLKNIKKYSPVKSVTGVTDFVSNPTLENAHAAKSDLLRIQRGLSSKTTLNTAERKQFKAVNDAINSIQKNMFKNSEGKIDTGLLDKYNKIQQGYANEVIPYRNKSINKFKRNEISAKELVNSLSHGEFMAKRGDFHPEISLRKKVTPALATVGAGSVAKMLYDNMIGNNSSDEG